MTASNMPSRLAGSSLLTVSLAHKPVSAILCRGLDMVVWQHEHSVILVDHFEEQSRMISLSSRSRSSHAKVSILEVARHIINFGNFLAWEKPLNQSKCQTSCSYQAPFSRPTNKNTSAFFFSFCEYCTLTTQSFPLCPSGPSILQPSRHKGLSSHDRFPDYTNAKRAKRESTPRI